MVEHCFCTAGVSGSNPLISTKKNKTKINCLRKEEFVRDPLVSRSDEGRGYLRKGSGSWKQALIRTYPNEETYNFLVTE